jgi:hypothetical protein
VVIRIAGVEKKMDRHLLGVPRDQGLASKLGLNRFPGMGGGKGGGAGGALGRDPAEMSAKDRRMLKMLQEELVDPDKMVDPKRFKAASVSGGKIAGPGRSVSNSLDLREVSSLTEAQRITTEFIKKVINGEGEGVVYVQLGANSSIKDKYRGWLKKNVLVRRHNVADLSDGGDAVTVIELVSDD